ncbi:hypothetical protein ZIOFF_026951 [Zingiber officinale]|uniref:Uncharacterized protein n=1 Tax=Zingiber officinale TaxID=94328 RepID=A0A8J5H5J4_ZINOF|nr:hypothetical protein ZIOFF_026951 [Zingiber officinale]
MRAVLAQRDLDGALLGIDNMSSLWTVEEKSRKDRKALSQIHLHLLNQILQDCLKETSAATLWRKLEQLCMTKSLTNKLHLKQRLHSHRMSEGTILEDHLIVFKEIISDLESGIHGSKVYDALLSKEKLDKLVGGLEAKSESLVARGTPHERSSSGDSWGRSKSRNNKDKTCRYSSASKSGKGRKVLLVSDTQPEAQAAETTGKSSRDQSLGREAACGAGTGEGATGRIASAGHTPGQTELGGSGSPRNSEKACADTDQGSEESCWPVARKKKKAGGGGSCREP